MPSTAVYAQQDADDVGDATTPETQETANEVPSVAGQAIEGDVSEVTSGGKAADVVPGTTAPPTNARGDGLSTPVVKEPVPKAVVEEDVMLGPGGRPMRTDYPGTEEALRARMETDRIQGVASGEQSSKEVYDLRVKELETRIDDLKDQVFRSKSRIVLLKETLLGNKLAGSKALVAYKNDIGKAFRLRRMTYVLDGNVLRNELDSDGSLSDKETINVFEGPLGPGTHNLVVQLEWQGRGRAFAMDNYTMKLEKACRFTVDEGMATVLDVTVYKEGGATERIDQSANIKCEATQTKMVQEK